MSSSAKPRPKERQWRLPSKQPHSSRGVERMAAGRIKNAVKVFMLDVVGVQQGQIHLHLVGPTVQLRRCQVPEHPITATWRELSAPTVPAPKACRVL